MTKIENQTTVTFTGETTKLPSGAINTFTEVKLIEDLKSLVKIF